MKYLSKGLTCSICGKAIEDEKSGYQRVDASGKIIAVYCESCGSKLIKEEENSRRIK